MVDLGLDVADGVAALDLERDPLLQRPHESVVAGAVLKAGDGEVKDLADVVEEVEVFGVVVDGEAGDDVNDLMPMEAIWVEVVGVGAGLEQG